MTETYHLAYWTENYGLSFGYKEVEITKEDFERIGFLVDNSKREIQK